MRRLGAPLLILALAALASAPSLAAGPARGVAPASDAGVRAGALVRDAQGDALGQIESVVTDAQGRAVQVVIRSRVLAGARTQLRAVPITSLRRSGEGYALPLRKNEFELLPVYKR